MKKLLALALALLAGASQAQTANVSKIVLWQYNLNQTVSPIYCALGTLLDISDRVTAAASTTITAVSGTPFANVAVGDMLHIVDGATDIRRAVTVRNSSTSVVVSGLAVTLTSGKIQSDSAKVSCGTTAAFGAFSTAGFETIGVQVDIGQQVNTGGLQFHLQCRASGDAEWVQQYPVLTFPVVALSYTGALASPNTGRFNLGSKDAFSHCRVGMFIVTNDDGNDLGTNAEQITITLTGRP
jgi:hypothetical protein